ncbi:MAG: TonB family protein [Acidobacteria bacterium]|nr:TonB family protein [Acidobacteriota bacterium]
MNNVDSERVARRHLSSVFWLAPVCAALMAAAPARAQQAEIDALAARLSAQIAKSQLKRVVVMDLVSPDDKSRPLGVQLTDQLGAALAKQGKDLEIFDRARVRAALEERKLNTEDVFDPKTSRFLSKYFGAQIVVTGSFARAENAVGIVLVASKLSESNETVGQSNGTIPMTKEIEAFFGKPSQSPPLPPGVFKAGQGGVSFPRCVQCPNPSYTDEEGSQKVEGTVVLEVIITPEGRATGITVKKSVSPGLDQRAVEAVRKWSFKPAIGPGGKPIPVRTTIEITFRILK